MNKKILISARSGGNYDNNQLFKKNYAYFDINKKKIDNLISQNIRFNYNKEIKSKIKINTLNELINVV